MGYIYKITNNKNDKVYIGKTQRTIAIRWKEHKKACFDKEKDNKLYRAMRKHGVNKFNITLLEEVDDSILSDRERFYIEFYNSYHKGYNMTFGGDGESPVDFSVIENLHKKGLSCLEIHNKTGHTVKTISSLLKGHGYTIKHSSAYKNNGKEVLFQGKTYSSYSELARHLICTDENFKNRKVRSVIQHISNNIQNKTFVIPNMVKGRRSDSHPIIGKDIIFNGQNFPSYTELAIYLTKTDNKFKNKNINTIIQGISYSVRNKKPYLSYYF